MKKRGLTKIITVLLLTMLTLVLITGITIVIIHRINITKDYVETLQILGMENAKIQRATGDFENGGKINITIQRAFSAAEKSKDGQETKVIEKTPVDIILVLDRSGSMRQSGWALETSLSPAFINTLNVPRNLYSSTWTINVPSNTARMAVCINWSKVPGYDGSEASEFAINLRRPTNVWIANNGNKPDALGNKVDPPDSVGASNEYFSGISTKPQCFYIENPQSGTWTAKVYGWNLRPKTNPPASQNVIVNVYLGNSLNLNKSNTILSSDTVKSASKDFVDRLDEIDRSAIVRFGSYAELTQALTSDKELVKTAIDNIGSEGGTYINLGIDEAKQHLFTNGSENSLKVITILTDGQNDGGPQTVIDSANQAKDLGYVIFTIGLTNFVDENLLKEIATQPEYYYYSEFNKLNEIYEQLSEKIVKIREIKTVGVSFILVFWNETSSCQKEINGLELPQLGSMRVYTINLDGCVKNITRIELYPKIDGKVGPAIDGIKV